MKRGQITLSVLVDFKAFDTNEFKYSYTKITQTTFF